MHFTANSEPVVVGETDDLDPEVFIQVSILLLGMLKENLYGFSNEPFFFFSFRIVQGKNEACEKIPEAPG